VDELFGFEQDGQVHVSSLLPKLLNFVVDIPMQFLCVAGSPIMTSSPKPKTKKHLRILNMNFQSLKRKDKLLEAIIETTEPDILIGTETLFYLVGDKMHI
jgi:hypothetical protein